MNKAFTKVGRMVFAAGAAVVGFVRNLLAHSHDAGEPNSRQLHDVDLVGEYNQSISSLSVTSPNFSKKIQISHLSS